MMKRSLSTMEIWSRNLHHGAYGHSVQQYETHLRLMISFIWGNRCVRMDA